MTTENTETKLNQFRGHKEKFIQILRRRPTDICIHLLRLKHMVYSFAFQYISYCLYPSLLSNKIFWSIEKHTQLIAVQLQQVMKIQVLFL